MRRFVCTNLILVRGTLIVAVWGSAQRSTQPLGASVDSPSLCKVLLALLLADLDLLLFTATAKLVGLECALRLEVVAAVLGYVAFRHVC